MQKFLACIVFSIFLIEGLSFYTRQELFAQPRSLMCRGSFIICKTPRMPSKAALLKAMSAKNNSGRSIRLSALIDKATFSEARLNEYGWKLVSCQGAIATVTGNSESAPYLSALDGITALCQPRPYPFSCACMDSVRKDLHLDPVYGNAPSNLKHAYTGKNVLVGIIETEFDTHHPAFLDAQGKTRFIALWDQQDTAENRQGTNYGKIEWANQLQTDSLFGLDPANSHGTGVTSYAAGSDISHTGAFPYFGVAPDAMIIGVKYTDANVETDVINGLQWIFHVADSLKVPCVVNMSIGIATGPHDGTSLTDRAIDNASSKRGRIVVGAIGNDGINCTHIAFTLASGESKGTWIGGIIDSLKNPARAIAVCGIDQWGEVGKDMADTLYILDSLSGSYKKSSRAVSTTITASYVDTVLWSNASTGKSDSVFFYASTESVSGLNKKSHIEITVISTNPALVMGVSAGFLKKQSGVIHAWNSAKKAFQSYAMENFFGGDSASTLNEIGGTAKTIITTGGYISKSQIYLYNGKFYDKGVQDRIGFLSAFSAAGPTIDGRLKPEICAPDEFVAGAMSRGAAEYGRTVIWPDTTNTYSRYAMGTGTSVAAPITTGLIALMLQANDSLSCAEAVQILESTAIKDQFTGPLAAPDNHWGYGKINALGALSAIEGVPVNTIPISKARLAPVLMHYAARGRQVLITKALFGAEQRNHLSLYSPSGRLVALVAVHHEIALLPYGLAKGIYFIELLSNGAPLARNKISVW